MSEFENRIDAQKDILRIVNRYAWPNEPLFSLSRKAINRWVTANKLDQHSKLAELVIDAANELFFLATKSQEQVTEDYQAAEKRIRNLKKEIAVEVDKNSTA